VLRRCVWSRNIKNGCSIYIYDISRLRVNEDVSRTENIASNSKLITGGWIVNDIERRGCSLILSTTPANLIFIGPCIVIYSYSTTNNMHLLSQIIYLCKSLYMFRTFFPSIIRSSKLRIQQRYMSNSCCYRGWYGTPWSCTSSPIAAAVWHIPLLHTQFWAPDDGRKDRNI